MATPATRMFRRLEGLFCVYKPSGVHWKLVRDSIETNLLKGEDNISFKTYPTVHQTLSIIYLYVCCDDEARYSYHCTLLTPLCCHLAGLNATPSQPLPREVRFLAPPGSEAEAPKGLTLSAASVPALSKHPLGMCVQFTAQFNLRGHLRRSYHGVLE